MQLHVVKVSPSKSGKALRVQSGDLEWYGAKKDSGIKEGMTIEAEIEDGQFGKWITKYTAKANGGNGHAAQSSSSTPSSGSGAAAPAWLPFASNTVAHAISAGLCKEPGQVSAWAKAAKDAFEALT